MGGSHSHRIDEPRVSSGRVPRLVLLTGLALAAAATVAGLFTWWPSASEAPDPVSFSAPGLTYHDAMVESVGEPCPVIHVDLTMPTDERPTFPEGCNELTATLLDGPDEGRQRTVSVEPFASRAGLVKGDEVRLMRIATQPGEPPAYAFFTIQRQPPLAVLAVVLVVAVALVARLRGILALVGLGFAGAVISLFMLPALLAGQPGLGVALAGSSAIMFVVLYLAHGLSVRTSTALAGTLVGIAITALVGLWGVNAGRLSGLGDEAGGTLLEFAPDLNFHGLLVCAVIIAGLGVLNDVTITQSSSVWELRAAAPSMSRTALFASGMRIGRDHIASTIYTIVFAYAGTALAVLMLFSLWDRPFLQLITDEAISEEIMRTLASVIGLVLAVPVTTAIAALTVAGPRDQAELTKPITMQPHQPA